MNFLTNINLTQNQIQNAVLHPLTNAPAGVEGQVYYNSVTKHLCIHNGTDWTDLTGGGSGYSLPIASAAALGGVKVGSNLALCAAQISAPSKKSSMTSRNSWPSATSASLIW